MTERADQVRLHLFYDRECPLCGRFKEWIERWDRQGTIQVLSLDDPVLSERFPQLDLDQARQVLTVCDRLGHLSQGVEALRQLTRQLPGIRRVSWVYQLPGVTPALNRVYRTVHRYRKRLCLRCGEKWRSSLKYSQRKKRSGTRR